MNPVTKLFYQLTELDARLGDGGRDLQGRAVAWAGEVARCAAQVIRHPGALHGAIESFATVAT